MISISFERVISLVNTAQVGQHPELQHNHRLKHSGLIAFQSPHWCRGYFTELVQETASLQAKFGGEITRSCSTSSLPLHTQQRPQRRSLSSTHSSSSPYLNSYPSSTLSHPCSHASSGLTLVVFPPILISPLPIASYNCIKFRGQTTTNCHKYVSKPR